MVTAFGMEWYFSPYLVPTFLAGLVAAILAAYAWGHRQKRTARPFVALMVGLCIWSVGYGVQLGFASQGPMLAMDKVSFIGSVVAPTAWFVLALEYAGFDDYLSRRVLGVLSIEPLLALAFVWTNELHGLIWRDVSVDASGPITVLDLTFGPAYWLNFAYSYLLLAAGIVILAGVVGRATRIYRWQSLFLVGGIVVPLGANASFHLVPSLNPVPNLDLTTFAFVVTGAVYALALFRYRMLDLVPAARERLVERMDDGVIVLADDGTIVDLNPSAAEALPNGETSGHVSETAIGDSAGVVEGLLSMDVRGESCSYDVSATAISDFRGEEAGQFVIMRDITQLEVLQAQDQRLSVLNRLLRHNVRNEMNVIGGRFELVAEEADEASNSHFDAIDRAIERVISMSDQARYIETSIAKSGVDRSRVDVARLCMKVVETGAEKYPEAALEWSGPEQAWVEGADPEQLERVLDALVENAVVHNTGQHPHASLGIETGDQTVRLVVADDGPGIPEIEQSVLDREREEPLEHGAGLGLWLVKWTVEAAGGQVSFEESEFGGSAVVVELPRASPPGGD